MIENKVEMQYPLRFNKQYIKQARCMFVRRFNLVKIYENYALYRTKDGIRECFCPWDLGLIPKRRSQRRGMKYF